jgi:hypothetical protein
MFGMISAAGWAQPFAADQRTVWSPAANLSCGKPGVQASPNPGAVGNRSLQSWTTPHSVFKFAITHAGRLKDNIVTVSINGRDLRDA